MKKIRKWLRIIHRDFGYFFFGATIIYSVSGIALNHLDDWNPSYKVTNEAIQINPQKKEAINEKAVIAILKNNGLEDETYKKHYFPQKGTLKIFIDNGSVIIDIASGKGMVEKLEKRFLLHKMNYLHYNPNVWWTWFSDIFAGALIILAISGLFLLRGKNGMRGRGIWLTAAGMAIPIMTLLWTKLM